MPHSHICRSSRHWYVSDRSHRSRTAHSIFRPLAKTLLSIHGWLEKEFESEDRLANNLFLSCSQQAGSDIYVVVLNLGDTDQTINLTQYYSLGAQAEVITSSVQSQYINGETVQTASFVANGNVGTVLVGIN